MILIIFFGVIMVIKRSRPILRYVWQSGLVGWGWMLEVGVDSEGGWKLNVRLEREGDLKQQ